METNIMHEGFQADLIGRDLARVGGWTLSGGAWTLETWYTVRRIRLGLKQGAPGYEDRLVALQTTADAVESFLMRAYFLEVRRLLAGLRKDHVRIDDHVPTIVTLFGVMWQKVLERAKRSSALSFDEWKELLLLQVEIVLTIERIRRTVPNSSYLLKPTLGYTQSIRKELWLALLPNQKERGAFEPLWQCCVKKLEPEEAQLLQESATRTKYDWRQRLGQAYSEVLTLLVEELKVVADSSAGSS